MEEKMQKITFKVEGMTCSGCENKIEKNLNKIDGVKSVKANFGTENVIIEYDANKVNLVTITYTIEKLGYKVAKEEEKKQNEVSTLYNKENIKILGIIAAIFVVYLIVQNTIGFNFAPEINNNMGYGMLFVIGILTSIHCVAMCGGINISQCSKYSYNSTKKSSKLYPSFLYNMGRVVSYTVIGAVVGALGSVISFTGWTKAIVTILSGILMLIMGLNMLNVFPWLRKFNPTIPRFFRSKVNKQKANKGPFYVGLLNGLMPCGPLQAMQIYALSTGSALQGALSMFLFAVGTVPLMFTLGALSSFLSEKFNKKMMKVSAALVIILAVVMIDRGLSLSGISLDINVNGTSLTPSGQFATSSTSKQGYPNPSTINGDVQEVTTTLKNGEYSPITVQKGVKVKWTIKVEAGDLNGCNNPVTIPKYNISKKLVVGDNVIEFTPTDTGKIVYTCWMGMVRSNIYVVDNVSTAATSDTSAIQNDTQDDGSVGAGGCCGGGSSNGTY